MGRKGKSITLSISEREKQQLEKLAEEYGMKWGENPNISKLVKAIARGYLQIVRSDNWSSDRINALDLARQALIDLGKIEEAIILSNILLERSEINIPLRDKIQQFLGNSPPAWRIAIERYIKQQQPFQLSYQDAKENLWQFTIYYAEIELHENRQYLDCWCQETEGNLDIEPLHHSWSLRLDRITDAVVIPISGQWRSQLDYIEVEFHLFNRLAYAYQEKSQDKLIEWIPNQPPIKRITREITNTYWFFRDIAPYWQDCVIISPENVRGLYLEKVKSLYEQYFTEKNDLD